MTRIKAAADSHGQIAMSSISDSPDYTGNLLYPFCAIWASGFQLNGMELNYKFTLAVMDRHQDNNTSRIEALSDTALILIDIISAIIYNDKNELINWVVNDNGEPFYDDTPDVVAGHIINITAKMPYTRNNCNIP